MSKKRGRSKQKRADKVETSSGVPSEEILAEGSGPSGEIPPVQAADGPTDGETLYALSPSEAAAEGVADHEAPVETASDETPDNATYEAAEGEGRDSDIGEPLEPAEGEALEATDGEDTAGDVTFGAAEGAEGADANLESADGEPLEAAAVDGDGEDADDAASAALPTSAASFDAQQLKQLVEALVFASDKPITVQRLRQLTRVADVPRLEASLAEITADYENRGLVLQQVSGGYQFRTRSQFSVWVQQLIQGRPVRLSRAQLETLAIVAYRQPITRPEIDDIRGVDSSATLKLLMDRLLIRVLGKKEEAGRPILYGTTKEFLDFFSLGDLREMPTLREYSELSEESRQVITSRLGPLEGPSSGGGGNDDGGGGSDGGGSDGGPSGPLGGDSSGEATGGGEELGAAPDPGSEAALRAYTDSIDLAERAELVAYVEGAPEDDQSDSEDTGAELSAESVTDVELGADLEAELGADSATDAEVRADSDSDVDLRADAVSEAVDSTPVADVGTVDQADVETSTTDTHLVASAIDAAFADVERANPSERSLDDAAPDELFAAGSTGTDFPSPESEAAPEPMLASGSTSTLAAARDEADTNDDNRARAEGDVPADLIADDAELGTTPAEPATE